MEIFCEDYDLNILEIKNLITRWNCSDFFKNMGLSRSYEISYYNLIAHGMQMVYVSHNNRLRET